MTLKELIEKVGQENIGVQHLSDCLIGARFTQKKKRTRIIFEVDGNKVGSILNRRERCLILWIPEEKWPFTPDGKKQPL